MIHFTFLFQIDIETLFLKQPQSGPLQVKSEQSALGDKYAWTGPK